MQPTSSTSLIAFRLTLPNRNYEVFSVMRADDPAVREVQAHYGRLSGSLSNSHKLLYKAIEQHPGINRKNLALLLAKPESTSNKQLKCLWDENYSRRTGFGKSGGYMVIGTRKGMEWICVTFLREFILMA